MRRIVLRMLSTNSLQAFSGAATTAPLHRPGPVRLVRAQPDERGQTHAAAGLPSVPPATKLPRGSLLNLSV